MPDRAREGGRARRAYRITRDPTVLLLVVITIAAVTALVLGYGPGGPVGDGGSGPNVSVEQPDDEDGPDRVPLVVEANRSDARVGQAVEITVRAGGRPASNATVSVEGERYRTGPDGTVVHTFQRGGPARVVAERGGNESVIYETDQKRLEVRRIVANVSVSTNRSRATVGEPVAVTVTGPDGEPVDATVTAAGRSVETDRDGRAVLEFRRAGNYTVDAERPPTDTTRYRSRPATVAVERRVVGLSVTVDDSSPVVGDEVALRVTRQDTGEPVNASVGIGPDRRWTGPDGRAVLEADRAGTVAVTASADPTEAVRFETVERLLVVERRTVALSLFVSDRRPDRGQQVTLSLRRGDTGRPVAGEIRIGGRSYRVDDDGTVRLRFDAPGDLVLRGRKDDTADERFRSAYVRVSVRGPSFGVSNLEVPDGGGPGEHVTINATVDNRGNEPGNATVALRFDDRTVATREVGLEPGTGRRIAFDVALPESPGTYRVTVAAGDDEASTDVVVADRFLRPGEGRGLAAGRAAPDSPVSPSGSRSAVPDGFVRALYP